jgi:ABC-2 type transport system permease protein
LIEYAPLRPIFGTYFIGLGLTGNFQPDFSCAFDPNFNTVQLDRQTIAGEESIFNPLVVFGSAQAMFFLLFTAQGSAGSIMELRREGVLQRMMVTPTPLISVLLGQMLGTFLIGLVQLVILSLAFTLVGSVIAGAFSPIWGGNLLLIGVVLVAAALSASGLGILLSGIASTPEQASIIGTVINMVMGVLGGAFFAAPQIPALQPFLWVSLVYWCSKALQTLAAGRGDVLLPVLVMGVIGVVTFFAGLMVFRRRLAS